MSRVERRQINLLRISGEVRERVAADAAEQGASIHDVIVGVLADEFSIPHERSGRPTTGARAHGTGAVTIWVLPRLDDKLTTLAKRRPKGSRSKYAVVEQVLRTHYRLDADAVAAA